MIEPESNISRHPTHADAWSNINSNPIFTRRESTGDCVMKTTFDNLVAVPFSTPSIYIYTIF